MAAKTAYEMKEVVHPVPPLRRQWVREAALALAHRDWVRPDAESRDAALSLAGEGGEIWLRGPGAWAYVTRDEIRAVLRKHGAKKKASRIGLAYWPALLDEARVDPRAYLEAERILSAKFGLWDGKESRGGWDSCGHRGIAPYQVRQLWYLAGCKPGRKFTLLMRLRINGINVLSLVKKGDTVQFIKRLIRGTRWLERHMAAGLIPSVEFSRKAIATIGRLSAPLRWAAVKDLAVAGTVRPRDLNWEAVKAAQKGTRAALAMMPPQVANQIGWVTAGYITWETRRREAGPLLDVSPTEVRLGMLRRLVPPLAPLEEIIPALNIVRLFGADEAAIRRFVGSRSIHDAGQFTLPPGRIDPAWGRLAAKSPSLVRQFGLIREIEYVLGGKVPETPAQFREAVNSLPTHSRFEYFGLKFGLSNREMEDYARLFQSGGKPFVGIPAPGGANGIADGEYVLRQLHDRDPLQPLAGRLVDCCQHLHGAAASCARAAWQQGDAAIWAVFRGEDMVGQAFVWRTAKGNALVLDSVEGFPSHRERIVRLMKEAAADVIGRLSVRKVYCGDSNYGVTEYMRDAQEVEQAPACSFALQYTDARQVFLLAEAQAMPVAGKATRRMVREATRIAQAEVRAVVFNELMPGSGVFCEHCEAEIHPDCEICPACGQNVAEWVEEEE